MGLTDSELKKHASKMFFSRLIPHYEFEDWLSVCMIARHKAEQTFNPAKQANLKSWTWTIVRHECTQEVRDVMGRANGGKFDEVRRAVRGAAPVAEFHDAALGGHNPHEFTHYVELFERLQADMNEQEAQVFQLLMVEESSYMEISNAMRISQSRIGKIARSIKDKAQAIAA